MLRYICEYLRNRNQATLLIVHFVDRLYTDAVEKVYAFSSRFYFGEFHLWIKCQDFCTEIL